MNATFVNRVISTLLLYLGLGLVAFANPAKGEPPTTGLVRQLDKLHDKLQLRDDQQRLWDNARHKSVEAQTATRADKHTLIEFAEAELERTPPDLGEIANRLDAVEHRNALWQREVRDLWLQVYAILSPQQKAIVRQHLKGELSHYKLLQNLRERFF